MPQLSEQQWTLGQLIDGLDRQPKEHKVNFDFGGLEPTVFDSYRGFYEDLALGYSSEQRFDLTVAQLLERARGAVGKEFTGWKGGDYVMKRDTALWVANSGETGNTIIVGFQDCRYMTVIATGYMPH